MKGYALEVKLIEWSCDCYRHSQSGMCRNPKSHKEKAVEGTYHGSFFYDLKTKRERTERFALVRGAIIKIEEENAP